MASLTIEAIIQESGGKQFDRQGKPGFVPVQVLSESRRYRHETGHRGGCGCGSRVGRAMRCKTDREYNLRLGNAYQTKLDTRFGGAHRGLWLAYNAGPRESTRSDDKPWRSIGCAHAAKTRDYIEKIEGVDVGRSREREESFADGILEGLAAGPKEPYKVDAPTAGEAKRFGPDGETMFAVANPGIDRRSADLQSAPTGR